MCLVPINDMQILPQPPPSPSKVAKLDFWSKNMSNVLNPMKKQFSVFCDFIFLRNGRFLTQFFLKPGFLSTLTIDTR